MNNIDYLNLDGRSLHLLKLVYELRSMSAAANQLGVNQSTVSHAVERLRRLLSDPLFIKSGRSLMPSAKMEAMIGPIGDVLEGLAQVANPLPFDAAQCEREFVLMANDYEHDLFVPPLFKAMREQAPKAKLRALMSEPGGFMSLQAGRVDVELSPKRPPNNQHIVRQPLWRDHLVVYYDAACRGAPESVTAYLQSAHARVQFDVNPTANTVDRVLQLQGRQREVVYSAPSFAALAAVLKSSDLLATSPSRLSRGAMAALSFCPVPLDLPDIEFAMLWHVKYRASEAHRWFRELVKSVAQTEA